MITVFDEKQRLHAPRTFIVSGKPQPIPEKPERIDMLLQGVKQIGSTVIAPPAITMETVALVHEQRYLTFLETLRERWGHVPDSSDIPLPNVYAIQRASLPPIGYPDAVVGQAGYHLGDGACPVTAKRCRRPSQRRLRRRIGASLVTGRRTHGLCLVPPTGPPCGRVIVRPASASSTTRPWPPKL